MSGTAEVFGTIVYGETMKFSELVCSNAIIPNMKANKRDEVVIELVNALAQAGRIPKRSSKSIAEAIIARENEASTGIGRGVAVPHVKSKLVREMAAAIGTSSAGIDFDSLDKQPVFSVILLVSPEDKPDIHLRAMETIFKRLQNDDFRKFLRQSQTVEQIKDLISELDDKTSF